MQQRSTEVRLHEGKAYSQEYVSTYPRQRGRGHRGAGSWLAYRWVPRCSLSPPAGLLLPLDKSRGEARPCGAGDGPGSSGRPRWSWDHRRARNGVLLPPGAATGAGEAWSDGGSRRPRAAAAVDLGARGHEHSGAGLRGGGGAMDYGETTGGGEEERGARH